MLHYVQQLVAYIVLLLFGDEQVAYNRFLEHYQQKLLPAAAKDYSIRAVRVNQNS